MNKETINSAEMMIENTPDPFDEPLEVTSDEALVFNDTYFAAARNSINVDGMDYSFLKPAYMNFDDQIKTKKKLREAFDQREFLLLYGYSGCGKTTILEQFAERYPNYVRLIKDFAYLPPMDLIVEMGKSINIPLKQRKSEIQTLINALKFHPGIIFLFDEELQIPQNWYAFAKLTKKLMFQSLFVAFRHYIEVFMTPSILMNTVLSQAVLTSMRCTECEGLMPETI